MNLITLNLIVREGGTDTSTFDEGEDDGLSAAPATPAQDTIPTTVSTAKIRNVHARKYGKPGTRVVFENGSAIVVSDLYDAVVALWSGPTVQ